MESRPDGEPCTVRFRWCSVYFVSEHHFIGGERTRHVERNAELEGQELDVAHPVHGGAAVLQNKSSCRSAIRQLLIEVLPALLGQDHAGSKDGRSWDEFVPADLVESIVDVVDAEGGGSYACDLWMHVEVTRVYTEDATVGFASTPHHRRRIAALKQIPYLAQ